MAKAYKCDRCGKLFERSLLPDIVVVTDTWRMLDTRLDFCSECQQSLENWLKESKDSKEKPNILKKICKKLLTNKK